jgi:hypothetical protein
MNGIAKRRVAAAVLCAIMVSTLLVLAVPAGASACGYNKWYLPEGYTGGNFDTYILVQNPNDCEAKVKVTFLGWRTPTSRPSSSRSRAPA